MNWNNFKIPTVVLLQLKSTLKIVILTRVLRSQDKVMCMNGRFYARDVKVV